MAEDDRYERVRVIVAFGDINGFSVFHEAVTDEQLELNPFFDTFDDLIDAAELNTGYTFFDTGGDGFMCLIDFTNPLKTPHIVSQVLVNLWNLYKQIEHLIQEKEPPKPFGFRVRVACGYVSKKLQKNGKLRYRGKHINWAHNALERFKNRGFICNNSIRQFVSEFQMQKYGITFKRINDEMLEMKIGTNNGSPKPHRLD